MFFNAKCTFLFLFFNTLIFSQERITLFDSTIAVEQDGSLSVTEKISVYAAGQEIKRGIVREFPTIYTSQFGQRYVVGFAIKEILLDGQKVNYHTQALSNGIRILIGEKDKFISYGMHTFTVTYQTTRHIGFFENHDELYWNVTGNGWRLPIDAVIARIQLPSVDIQKVTFEAYTGKQAEQGANYQAYIENGTIVFQSTKKLQTFEGLTIVVALPKGLIAQPTTLSYLWYFVSDNLSLIVMFLWLLLLIGIFSYVYITNKRKIKQKAIIPLFYPPEGYSPGMVRFLKNMKYDSKVFAAEIVNMAVQEMITIEYKPGKFLSSSSYALHAKEGIKDVSIPFYKIIYDKLFHKEKTILFPPKNTETETILHKTIFYLNASIYDPLKQFFNYHIELFLFAGFSSFIFICAVIAVDPLITNYFWFIFLCGLYVICFILFYWLLSGYTQSGQDIKNQIEGFRLFLSTVETDRLKIVGTPPDKTPELYETYLPYAIALGVEEQWSKQFAPIFEQMAKQGVSYTPMWYIGPHYRFDSFASNLGSQLSSQVQMPTTASSSSRFPGSSSGSGGSGSSGGGSGGGGGGGW